MVRMNSVLILVLLGLIVLVGVPATALHPYYEQNGDCYVLIGDGPFRATYALNNKVGGPVVAIWNLVYNGQPKDAYGITAAQEWDGFTSQKRLYIFAGRDTGWQSVTGFISRRMVPDYSLNQWPPSEIPPYIVHRYHGPPNQAPSGRGNHPQSTLDWKFGGFDYPCSKYPAATPGRPGYFEVEAGKWYHSLDHPVWSPYTYGWWAGGGGGWVHYVVRENVQEKVRQLRLHQFNVNTNTINPPGYPINIKRVKTGEQSTMDQKGECVDGCINENANMVLPGEGAPYVDVVFSSSTKKAYLYQRPPDKTTYDLTGVDGNTTIVGTPSDLTTMFLGVSSKNNLGDYLYVVGTKDINDWLAAASYPGRIGSMTDFAVSDQWWQTGGIAYAYEKSAGLIYKFVRDERTASPTAPEVIPLATDVPLPDSIGADGFGHLYMMRTELEPARPADFTKNDAYAYSQYWTDPGNGDRYYVAKFRQNAYKTVYQRDYYTKVTTKIAQRIPLGKNEFTRNFIVRATADVNDRNTWNWNGGYVQIGPSVQTDYLTKIGVINSPTPPQVVGNRNGLCDINGPMLGSSTAGIYMAQPISQPPAPGPDYFFSGVYIFQVENAPRFDANGINVGNAGRDVDSDGVIGNFVSTIEQSTLKYYWKAYKIVDAASNTVSEKLRDDELDGTYSTSSLYADNFTPGRYRVGVKVRFAYYDYDKLPPDSRKSDQASVLTGPITALNGAGVADYSYKEFTIIGASAPATVTGNCIVSGRPMDPVPPTASYTFLPDLADTTATTAFVIPELVGTYSWAFMLRDNNFPVGIQGNIAKMWLPKPVVPPSVLNYDGSTLRWRDNQIKVNWTSTLVRDGEVIVQRELPKFNTTIVADGDTRYLFPVPSQPEAYDLSCVAMRIGEVSIYVIKGTYVDSNGQIQPIWERVDNFPLVFEARGKCKVIVQDRTGPALKFVTPSEGGIATGVWQNHAALYGTTGESLVEAESPPNAADLSAMPYVAFVVADNNPFGNAPTGTYANYQDPYHHNITFPYNRDLRVRHNYSGRYGMFIHTNRVGTIPANAPAYRSSPAQNNADASYGLKQFDLRKSDFAPGGLVPWIPASQYDKALSYRLYRIALSDIRDFRPDGAPFLSFYEANNLASWTPPRFGIVVKDASQFTTASPIDPLLSSGPIVIRDNDRPNVFLQIREMKHNLTNTFPSNLKPAVLATWTYLSQNAGPEANHNGIEVWNFANNANLNTSISGAFKVNVGANITTSLSQVGTDSSQVIEVDVPVFIKAIIHDNVGTDDPAYTEFRLLDLGGGDFVPPVVGIDGELRQLFRRPTTPSQRYKVTITVRDHARGWPTNPEDPVNSAPLSDSTRNRRKLEVEMDVFDATLDVRILERTQQR
jgi:hypothetical protein